MYFKWGNIELTDRDLLLMDDEDNYYHAKIELEPLGDIGSCEISQDITVHHEMPAMTALSKL